MLTKILQLVPKLDRTGVASVVRNYFDFLYNDGYAFDFVSHGEYVEEDYYEGLRQRGCNIFCIDTIGTCGIKAYSKEIKKIIEQNGPYDVIHIHLGDITGLYAYAVKRITNTPVIVHAHTARAITKSRAYLRPIFMWLAIKYADKRLACGDEAGKYCFGKNNFIILPNGLNIESYQNIKVNKSEYTKSLGIESTYYIIGQVAALIPQKNYKFSIDVFCEYHKKNKKSVFVIIGEGPLLEDLKNYIDASDLSDCIIFLGKRSDVNELMHIMDAFILPSLFEGLPVVGVEAQAAGIPTILLSDTVDRKVDTEIGNVNFLSIKENPCIWANMLAKREHYERPNDQCVYKQMTAHGYNIKKTVDILENTYQMLISNK